MNRLPLYLSLSLLSVTAHENVRAGVVAPTLRIETATGLSDAKKSQSSDDTGWLPLIIKLNDETTRLPEEVVELYRRDRLVLAYVPRDMVEGLSCDGYIARIEGGKAAYPALDVARNYTSYPMVEAGKDLPTVYTGKGVVVGFTDIGFDPNHPAFRDEATGQTRVGLLTDYTLAPSGNVRLETKEEIARWQTDDADEWHATHVAGILAGGYRGNPYYGIATGADIVATTSDLYDALLLAGMEDIIAYARQEDKPAVINMSISSTIGPHDGSSLFCQYLEKLSEDAVICISAGNDGQRLGIWTCDFPEDAVIGAGTVDVASWVSDVANGYLDVWSADYSVFNFAVTIVEDETQQIVKRIEFPEVTAERPEMDFVVAASQAELDRLGVADANGIVDEELAAYMTGYFHIATEISPENNRFNGLVRMDASNLPDESGKISTKYIFTLEVSGKKGQRLSAYASDGIRFRDMACYPSFPVVGTDGLINDFITGEGVIGVGAMCSRNTWPVVSGGENSGTWTVDDVTMFSSYSSSAQMPGEALPDIVAPGAYLVSSISTPYLATHPDEISQMSACSVVDGKEYYWYYCCGTSMSSPYVAGVCALWLEADPSLSPSRIKEIMLATARPPEVSSWNKRWGKGILDSWTGLYQIAQTGGIGQVEADVLQNGHVQLFTLQGLPVMLSRGEKPSPGVYVSRQGTDIRKIVVR